jgi:hypothetical protein
MTRSEEIAEAIKNWKGTRVELDKYLSNRYKVKLTYRKYRPHTGLKQRVRNLMKTGLTKDEALDKLDALDAEVVNE